MERLQTVEVTTLGDLLVRAAQLEGDRPALVMDTTSVSYDQLLRRSVDRARSLLALGVGRHDHVGLLMPNCVEFVEMLFGAALLGAVAVPINSRFRARELRYVIDHADLKVLVTSDVVADHADHPARIAEAFPELGSASDARRLELVDAPHLRSVVVFGGPRAGFVSQHDFERGGRSTSPEAVERLRALVKLRDLAAILYTSGTTANPKGCMHTHEALVRNGMTTGRSRFLLNGDDVFWDPLPMFHVGALLPLIATFDAAGTFVSMTHFDGSSALELIERTSATWLFPAFPAITNALLDDPSFPGRDLNRVRMTMCVGPPAMLRRLQGAVPGAVQISTYGSTETGGVITYHLVTDSAEQRATTCGPPFRGIEIEIDHLEREGRAATGEVGEILVRGYSITDGYYKDPETTNEAFDENGWFHTGDLGSLDEAGHVVYAGRLKDMLKVGGENVSALEVEEALSEHQDVLTAQVVGVPDERLDEVVAAFIEPRPDSGLTEQDLIEFCHGRIASFKVPRYVRFIEEWPMSATKIQKHELRRRIAEELQQSPRADDTRD